MSEMANRVAQAIADVWCEKPGNTEAARLFEKTARAAIEAMREPTSAMETEACWHLDTTASDVWKSMIDEALK